ncbi:2-hydroxy-6-oxo-6-phenylhexa-2,4-dienoate hydrolase [Clostridium acetobutylicum]|nr:2-hydroxy-6-oxo-6-phenylhexa-2,4-dienoate hydrolase [Clostridium acetobutylicum]
MKLNIKDVVLNYNIIGEGEPIIILHGYSVDHTIMFGCMEKLFSEESRYKRIYVDLPGMGKSTSSDSIKTSDDMLDIILEFIMKVTKGENFLLVGESYGGYLSRGVVYKIREKVNGLFLICPAIIPDFNKRTVPEHVILAYDEKLMSKLNKEEAEEFSSMSVVQNEKIYLRFKEEIMSGIKLGNQDFLERLQREGYGFSFDVDKIPQKFDKPTLMLLGKQDSSVGYKDAWNILDNYPRATFAVLDMAGHNLQIEQEDIFNLLGKEWISRTYREKDY